MSEIKTLTDLESTNIEITLHGIWCISANNQDLPLQEECFICNESIVVPYGLEFETDMSISDLFKLNSIKTKGSHKHILACYKHKNGLELLTQMIVNAGNIVNKKIIEEVIHRLS